MIFGVIKNKKCKVCYMRVLLSNLFMSGKISINLVRCRCPETRKTLLPYPLISYIIYFIINASFVFFISTHKKIVNREENMVKTFEAFSTKVNKADLNILRTFKEISFISKNLDKNKLDSFYSFG